jgi:hemerythrin-like domain-containing protein
MPIKNIVRWLRSEHNDLRDYADRLRETVAKPPRGGREKWITELAARIDEFAARVRQRMEQEERDGYLRPLVEARPALAPEVDLLRHEHAELAKIIESVQRAVHQLSPRDNLLVRDCCKRIEDLLYWLERHEEHEDHIVLYALGQGAEAQS